MAAAGAAAAPVQPTTLKTAANIRANPARGIIIARPRAIRASVGFILTLALTNGIIRFLVAVLSHSWVTERTTMFWQRRNIPGGGISAAFILAFVPASASAKETRFWNLTANTITSLQLSPPGKDEWGR